MPATIKAIFAAAAGVSTAAMLAGMSSGLVPSVAQMLYEDRRAAIVDASPSDAGGRIQPVMAGARPHSASEIEAASRWRTTREGYAFPPNGKVEVLAANAFPYVAEVRIMDRSGNGLRKTVTFSDHATGSPVARAFMEPNHGISVSIPPGVYRVRLEMGMAWCDAEQAFCPVDKTFDPPPLMVPPEGTLVDIPRIGSTGQ